MLLYHLRRCVARRGVGRENYEQPRRKDLDSEKRKAKGKAWIQRTSNTLGFNNRPLAYDFALNVGRQRIFKGRQINVIVEHDKVIAARRKAGDSSFNRHHGKVR